MDVSDAVFPSTSGLTMAGQTSFNACGMMEEPICKLSPNRRTLYASGLALDAVDILHSVTATQDNETAEQR